MDEIERRVLECLAGVFPDIAPELLTGLNQSEHEAWDSVAHVTLYAALAEAFECDLDFEAFAQARSFSEVVAQVKVRRLAEDSTKNSRPRLA